MVRVFIALLTVVALITASSGSVAAQQPTLCTVFVDYEEDGSATFVVSEESVEDVVAGLESSPQVASATYHCGISF